MAYTQDNRPLRVATALGKDVLLLERFSGEEGVSTPFRFTLDLSGNYLGDHGVSFELDGVAEEAAV